MVLLVVNISILFSFTYNFKVINVEEFDTEKEKELLEEKLTTFRIAAVFGIIAIYMKAVSFIKFSDRFSPLIEIVQTILADIVPFMVLMILFIICFGICFFLLG